MSIEKAIFENWLSANKRIVNACARVGRLAQEVTLLAVTKTMSLEAVQAAFTAGMREAGENRVQELLDKKSVLPKELQWHFIGHLQGNKAVKLLDIDCDVIASLDSVDLARRVDRLAGERGRKQRVLIEINLGREPQKYGFLPQDAMEATGVISKFPNLSLEGLMGVVPMNSDPQASRPFYQEASRLMKEIGRGIEEFRVCSIGTSQDFEVAIEEGSTMVRLGSSIFGDRSLKVRRP